MVASCDKYAFSCLLDLPSDELYNVRLTGGTDSTSGMIEIYFSSQWLPVCQDDWGAEEAQVVCRQVNYPFLINTYPSDSHSSTTTSITGVACLGSETSLADCDFTGATTTGDGSCQVMDITCSGREGTAEVRCLRVEFSALSSMWNEHLTWRVFIFQTSSHPMAFVDNSYEVLDFCLVVTSPTGTLCNQELARFYWIH